MCGVDSVIREEVDAEAGPTYRRYCNPNKRERQRPCSKFEPGTENGGGDENENDADNECDDTEVIEGV